MDELVRCALRAGVTELAITDHYDPLFPDGPADLDFPRYMDELARVKETYRDRIRIAAGIELGLQPGRALELCRSAVRAWSFDFVIGSIHAVDGYGLHTLAYERSRSPLRAKTDYYASLLACIREFDDFDILGHLNVVDRYTPPIGPNDEVDGLIDEIFGTLVSRGQGIEIHPSPLREGRPDPMPPAGCVKRFAELGGSIVTLSSDAHNPRHIGSNIEKAAQLAKAAGIESAAIFQNRRIIAQERL
jgi:histidinol-phosphatase (PHP family)